MEPVSTPPRTDLDQEVGKEQRGKGRAGSLENPETYVDVPGHVIPILEREFDDFDSEAEKFLAGQTPEDQFIGFRLKQGVYGQRQPDVQMVRVKLPFGGVTPEQMEMFGDVVERYAPLRKGHITTRQNVQIHHVPLRDMETLIREISDVGLSSREGCGNTVRNVTGDPWAGVAADELFDPTPYAGAFVRYFVRHPTTQLMPRKVKTAFSGSDADRAITGIHDIGFISRIRDGVRGFEVRVGGGTSIMPRVAPTLTEFAAADDGTYLKYAEAALRIFDRQSWLRVNRARARIKVLVDKVGIEEFRAMVAEELEGDWVAERDFAVERLRFDYDESERAAAGSVNGSGTATPNGSAATSANGDSGAFEQFRERNVQAQRQQGFSAVEVKITRGDLTPEQFRGLGAIIREHSGGYARTTVQQNLVLRWVPDSSLHEVWRRLSDLGLAAIGPREITDVVSCPGTDSCKLGITSSMGLNEAVQKRLEEMRIPEGPARRIQVKMSGCPNGCSQHHISNIGFYGASLKIGDRQMPAYIPHVGGNYEGGEVIYGKRLKARLPARRVPEAVERWVRMFEAEGAEGEEFNDYVERVDTGRFEREVSDLTMPAEFSLSTMREFIDWNRSDPYKVERGEGECAI